MTNADKIRAMSDESLMRFLFNEAGDTCAFCIPARRPTGYCDGNCKNGILNYLKSDGDKNG